MSKYILLCIVLIAIFASNNINANLLEITNNRVQITEIRNSKNAHIIYAFNEDDSSQLAIVSLKCKSNSGSKIKVGNTYNLRIKPYFKNDIFPDHMVIFEVLISGKKIIVPSKGWASNVYTTPDLKGLRFIESK